MEKVIKYCTKLFIVSVMMVVFTTMAEAQTEVLTLDQCRQRALEANKGLKQAELKCEEMHNMERAALWQMMPRVSAVGGYMWMEKSVNLLSEEQKDRFNHLGDNVQADISESLHGELDDVPLVGSLLADRLDNVVANSGLGARLNNVGQDVVNGLETDTRNLGMATVTLSQPIYVGGKLAALHRTAELAEHLADVEYSKEEKSTIVAVDEAYWQVVSVGHKLELATRYAALLDTLENNVQAAVDADMATKGDLAKVRVKRNEAQMNLTKASNGLMLAKMLLAERCGMPLDSDFEVAEGQFDDESLGTAVDSSDMETVYDNRCEMRMLRISDSIAQQGVRIAASILKPNVVATAGYLVSNPNVFDGFSNTWGGTWMAGVVVQVPIFHPSGIYAVKAAKAKRQETAWKMHEAEELISLQVNKCASEQRLAEKKLAQAESNLDMAEENLRLADESFKAGMCNSSDLMAAQTAWLQAEGEVLDARIEIEMTKVYLKQALGE